MAEGHYMKNIAEFRMYQERWRKAVLGCEDLTDRQKVILLALQEYENVESRTAWPSRDMLAADCALRGEVKSMRRNVTNALSAGNRLGFIEVSAHAVSPGRAGGRGRSTVWRLTLPEGKLTDKSVRKDSVKGDPSVTVSEGSNIKGDRRSAKRVTVESPKGDRRIPPNPVGTPDKNPSYTGAPGSADAGKDGKAVEVPTFGDLLSAYPDSIHTKKDARNEWERLTDDEKRRAIRAARKVQPNEPAYVTGLGKWIREKKADWPLMPEDMYAAALADPSSIGDLLRATGLSGPAIRWDDRPRDVAVREDNLAWLRENESMILTHLNR